MMPRPLLPRDLRLLLAQRSMADGSMDGTLQIASPRRASIGGGFGGDVEITEAIEIHHVAVQSMLGQMVAAGGELIEWESRTEGAPDQRRGFTTLAAGSWPVTQIPIDLTGVMNLRLEGLWGEEQESGATIETGRLWREGGSITMRLIRGGVTIGSKTYPSGRAVTSRYAIDDDGWEVQEGDLLEVELPNSSAEAQRHRQAKLRLKIIGIVAAPATQPGWTQIAAIDAWGITQDDSGNWWTTDGAGFNVTQYDADWNQLQTWSWHFAGTGTSSPHVRGIAWTGTQLLLTGNDPQSSSGDHVHIDNTDGSHGSSFVASGGTALGLAWDGTDIWEYEGGAEQELRRYATDGTLLQTIVLGGNRRGLAYHEGNIVVMNAGDNLVEVWTTAGALLRSVPGPDVGDMDGVYVKADGTLYASKDGDGVYVWDGGQL